MTATTEAPSGNVTARLLDAVERVGNRVPHPALMFFYLIIGVIVISHVLYLLGVSVAEQVATDGASEAARCPRRWRSRVGAPRRPR